MRLRLLLLSLLVLVLTACGTAEYASTVTGRPKGGGQAAKPVVNDLDFSSTTVAGDSFDGRSLEGKPVVLWFWAPWCPTCRRQVDGVGALAMKYGDKVRVVGVGSLDDSRAIEDFAGRLPDRVTMLDDSKGEVWRHFKVTAQSTYLVLDAQGREQAAGYLSEDDLDAVVAKTVG